MSNITAKQILKSLDLDERYIADKKELDEEFSIRGEVLSTAFRGRAKVLRDTHMANQRAIFEEVDDE